MALVEGRIYIDVSEFVDRPLRTGVQRVLFGIMRHLPAQRLVPFRIIDRDQVGILDPAIGQLMQRYFDSLTPTARSRLALAQDGRTLIESAESLRVRRAGAHPLATMEAADLFRHASAVLNLENFSDPERSAFYLGCDKAHRHKVFHWVHDFLVYERPEVFPQLDWRHGADYVNLFQAYAIAGGYFAAHPVVAEKIARYFARPIGDVHVVGAGCDLAGAGVPEPSRPEVTRVVALGTLEPRKFPLMIANAMESVARSADGPIECLMIGRSGWLAPDDARALRDAFERGLVRHLERVADADLARLMSATSVAVSVSELEGFGLPVVEFAARGVPVVVNAAVPAATIIPDELRVDCGEVSELTLAAAIRTALAKGISAKRRYTKTWAECAAEVLHVIERDGTPSDGRNTIGFDIVPRIAAMVGRETRPPREIKVGVAREIAAAAAGGVAAGPSARLDRRVGGGSNGANAGGGLADEITDLLLAARGRLFWTEIEAVRELLAAFIRAPLADNHIETLRRAHATFLDRSIDARSAAQAPTYSPLARTLRDLREIALGKEAEGALGPETIANLRLVLQPAATLLDAASADPFELFTLFDELGLSEPSVDDALEAKALLAEGVHPFELLLFFGHRRAPAGDEIGLLLEILADIVERRGARIRATYAIAELADGGSDLTFLRRSYRLVLRTEIDDDGLAYYLDALRRGELTRANVLLNLANADTARRRAIRVI